LTAKEAKKGPGLRVRITLLVEIVLVITVGLTIAVTIYPVSQISEARLEQEACATTSFLAENIASAQNIIEQVDVALGEQMIVQARLAAHFVAAAERAGMTPEEINGILKQLADSSAVDEFRITDESARAYLTNADRVHTFSPSLSSEDQADNFFRLLNEQDGVIVLDAQAREEDGQIFKYVGVSGVDLRRIVQVGSQVGLLEELAQAYSVQGQLDGTVSRADIVYAQIVDTEGNVVALSRDTSIATIPQGGLATREDADSKDAADVAEVLASAQIKLRWEPSALIVTAPVVTAADKPAVSGVATVYFSTADLEQIRQQATTNGLIVGALMCAIGGLVSYWMAGRMATPLQSMVDLAQEVADGDLTKRIQVSRTDELGQLGLALGQMTDKLHATIQSIRKSARHVGDSASGIDQVVGELNKTVSQQSAAVAETTSAMGELRTVAEQIADGAQVVDDSATLTQNDVHAGLEAVSETVARMEEIRTDNEASVQGILALGEKAQEIGSVMNIIDDIADQTKLISINASIEAAAAGQAGERFNVVASQVRSLAENVAQSTEEIRQRIREIQTATNELTIAAEMSTKKIDWGVAHSQTTQKALDQIAVSADQTTISAKQISVSTRQQQTAVEQVVVALQDLSQDVSRVAASSNQTAQVVAALGDLSETLNQLVARFDLGDREA